MLIPEMVSRGYPRAFATALITCSSILGVLIPPSTPMIIFGWVTGTNVLACFLSTVGPGIVTIIIFCGINFVLSRRFDLKLMPQLSKTEKRRQIAVRGWKALPALIMPVLILGGIYSGAMTPTEAAAVAVIYALPVGFFVYRGLNLRNAFGCTKDSAVSVGSIMIMIFCSMMLSQTYVVLQIPQAIVESVFSITDNSFLKMCIRDRCSKPSNPALQPKPAAPCISTSTTFGRSARIFSPERKAPTKCNVTPPLAPGGVFAPAACRRSKRLMDMAVTKKTFFHTA